MRTRRIITLCVFSKCAAQSTIGPEFTQELQGWEGEQAVEQSLPLLTLPTRQLSFDLFQAFKYSKVGKSLEFQVKWLGLIWSAI